MHIRYCFLRSACVLVLMQLFTLYADACYGNDSVRIRIMFYNVENLFDTFDDPVTEDDDFLPSGLMRWSISRYNKKLISLSKTIIAAGEWDPPAVVAMCEVENRKVIDDLVSGSILGNYNYGIIHEDSPDPRGIDVCMIFRKDIVRILEYRTLQPSAGDRVFKTRKVLYVQCNILDDTIHLLFNHWPSRRGGVLAAGDIRSMISAYVGDFADSLQKSSAIHQKILIAGDFNCSPDDDVMQSLYSTENNKIHGLINLSKREANGPAGTYRYRGSWELLDQIIVSEGLINNGKGLYTRRDSYRIFNGKFLFIQDQVYPGVSPFSTYRGYRYQGGFSDHLPVLIDLFPRH